MSKLFTICLALCLSACATTSSAMNKLHLGMSREEVINELGEPTSTGAEGGAEYLNYSLSDSNVGIRAWSKDPYFVRIINGKVDAYGRTGELNSAAAQATK